jgi:AraC-like DNA-binding protein
LNDHAAGQGGGEVGYQDTSFFGRLFRRKVALTLAQYRRRLGALGAQLRLAAD